MNPPGRSNKNEKYAPVNLFITLMERLPLGHCHCHALCVGLGSSRAAGLTSIPFASERTELSVVCFMLGLHIRLLLLLLFLLLLLLRR